MTYRELAPLPELETHVTCLWERTGAPPLILPDGCADLVWTGSDLVVVGPATRAMVARVPSGETKLGIRFRVGSAGAALGMPAAEVLNGSPSVAEIWRGGDEWTERVGGAPGARARLDVMAESVAARLARLPEPDPLLRAAVLQLSRPGTRIAELGRRLGISERQLRRRFDAAVGYSPKTLARVLRLQRFLGLGRRGGDLARVAADAGYADQPHLTRDCARLTGLPAATLLASGAAPAGESLREA